MLKMKKISDEIKANSVDDFEQTNIEEIEVKDKIKKENVLVEALKSNELDIYLSNQKRVKEFTDLLNNIVEEKPLENNIQEIFINKNDLFDHDDIIDKDEKFINNLVGGTHLNFNEKIYNGSNDSKMEVVNEEVKEEETKSENKYQLEMDEKYSCKLCSSEK